MTKIDAIPPPVQAPEPKPAQTRSKTQGDSFQAVLQKAAQQADQPPALDKTAEAVGDVAAVKPADMGQDLPPLHTEGIMRAERTLDQLDHYTKLLGDQGKSLREVHQALTAVEEEVGELTKVLDQLDKDDPVYPLLESVAVTAMVESIKFNRGDYVSGAE